MITLRLAHLYPEQMNIYGDRGNVIALTQRCAWRGIQLDVVPITAGSRHSWDSFDLAFFGGGQDSGQALIAEDLVTRQAVGLRAAIDDGLVLLAICGGYQLLGHYFLTHTGEQLPGIGALDAHTVGGGTRMIGNIVVAAEVGAQVVQLVGFENHSGRTYLGPTARPLGRVLTGYGNNGEDGTEGTVHRNVIGCYMHGSLLPKNPQLADHMIAAALRRRGLPETLAALSDTAELRAQRGMIERLVK